MLVLRRMFYIKERKLSRLFGCYLSNKIRTIICQKKNMKKVLKKDQKQQSENISRLCICICHEAHGVFFEASSLAFRKQCENTFYLPKYVYLYMIAGKRKHESQNSVKGFPGTGANSRLSQ